MRDGPHHLTLHETKLGQLIMTHYSRPRGRVPALATALAASTLFLYGIVGVHAQLARSLEFPKTNFDKASVDLQEIQSGGPPRDGIPAIDEPVFVSADNASEWIDPREPVIVVEAEGDARAYPLQILIYHEIVNDVVAGRPIAVTFCPLCNASIVFDRRVGDRVLDFGTTGRLRKSDLVMYDRQTESWWQQFTGEAIVGELTGTELGQLPAAIVAFQDFRSTYPQGRVLSRDTGYSRPYGRNPYRGYDSTEGQPFLFFDPVDDRLPAMERVLNVSIGDAHKIYPLGVLRDQPVVNDEVNGVPIVVFTRSQGTLSVLDDADIAASKRIPAATAWIRRAAGKVLTFTHRQDGFADQQTGSLWNVLGRAVSGPLEGTQLEAAPSGVHFAFAWLAFRPDSEIHSRESD